MNLTTIFTSFLNLCKVETRRLRHMPQQNYHLVSHGSISTAQTQAVIHEVCPSKELTFGVNSIWYG